MAQEYRYSQEFMDFVESNRQKFSGMLRNILDRNYCTSYNNMSEAISSLFPYQHRAILMRDFLIAVYNCKAHMDSLKIEDMENRWRNAKEILEPLLELELPDKIEGEEPKEYSLEFIPKLITTKDLIDEVYEYFFY
jgi:hypothetical protein